MDSITGTPDVIFPNIGIIVNELNRVAFDIFGYKVYWYGIIIGIGILLGLFAAVFEARRCGMNPELIYDFFIFAVIGGIVGSRLYYVIFSWDNYKGDLLSIFNIRNGGIAIYGCIIGSVITAIVYTFLHKIKFFKFGDICVFGLIVGQIIGRWGNYFNREAFGGFTNSPFAMMYLRESVENTSNITQDILNNIIMLNGAEYIQVHPTFLYESLWNLGLLIFMSIYKKRKKFDGEITAIYFVGYAFGRFWIEGLRTDQLLLWGTSLAISQILSAVLVVVGITFILYNRQRLVKKA